MAVSQDPLSVRNNNPGNLRYVGQEGATPGEGGFARFESREAGMEAMRRQIELDTQKRGMNLNQFINKYAPPSENKTQGYVDFVVQKTGLDPTQPVPAEMIPAIQTAMIQMEGGPRAVSAFSATSAPAATQATPTATRPTQYVQVAQGPRTTTPASPKLTDLPPSYRAALAANYIADTEDPEVSIADKAMAMLEEMQGGGGPRGAATFNKMMGQEEGVSPFALMAKAQEPEAAPRRRPVPRMPKMMANGGEVSNEVPRVDAQGRVIRDAPIPERPLSPTEKAVGAGEAALSLASGITAPASIAYDVMRGVPRQEVSPSRFMYTPRTEGGQRAAEGLGRFMQEYKLDVATPQVQLQRPYPVGAAAKQGIAALRETGEALELPFMTDTPPVGAVKPGGGVVDSYGVETLLKGSVLNQASEMFKARTGKDINSFRELEGSPEGQNVVAAERWISTKAKEYFAKQYGSPRDPVLRLFEEGKYIPRRLNKAEEEGLEVIKPRLAAANRLMASDNPDDQATGKLMLSSLYDKATPVTITFYQDTVRNRLKNPQYRDSIIQYLREEKDYGPDEISVVEMDSIINDFANTGKLSSNAPFFETDMVEAATANTLDVIGRQIKTQGGVYGGEFGRSIEVRGKAPSYLSPAEKENVSRGEPIYTPRDDATSDLFSRREVAKYMLNTPKEKWETLTFPEMLLRVEKASEKSLDPIEVADRIDNYKPVTREQRLLGTNPVLPLQESSLGKGATWREITTPGGLQIEGRLLKHCVSQDPKYESFLVNDQSKFFALRDKDGKSYVTIQVDRLGQGEDGPFANIRQVKGFRNADVGEKYAPEIMQFLENYEKQIGVPLRYTEGRTYLPPEVRGLANRLPENFAKGGMVDKPLYDRAA